MGHYIVQLVIVQQYSEFHSSVNTNKLTKNFHIKMEELRDRYYGGEGQSRDAFEELCAMYEAFNSEREERREQVQAKIAHLRERNAHLRERNARLREKYAVMVDAYNNLAEEAKERSDSSSSSSSDENDDCCIM